MSQANAAVREMPKAQVWRAVCAREDLVLNSGVVALVGNAQVALFFVASIGGAPQLFAVDNRDPVTGVNVMGRGLVGSLGGDLVIASPLYKQRYRLVDGTCLEDAALRLRTWPVRLVGDVVEVGLGD
ncbi:nitrite reductase small subunit NirD [Pseudomonas sp. W2Oct36]|jgi:nitrite reductase (NADH) small subunit|uniref:nitrite reductase small subunit NirD n=1 Tax=unclassified Pseudomonas TaxID=196821 RepID=UPI00121E78EF|nr:nitrite reductase small subunit NirD [Pseudomonas sp.]RZI75047.1 MAG: nitrite reductase small subunit NirD [Pseudomonas sp.]